MSISQALLAEFEQESDGTRKTLERLPEGKFDFKPHEKSPTLAWLAGHVANLPHWGVMACTTDELDLAAPEHQERPPRLATVQAVMAEFEKHVAALRATLPAVSDERMMQPWTLRMGDKVLFTLPRVAVLRGVVFNHLIHHRAQLTVYLRMTGVPVPALYGPSADEGNF